MGWCVWGLCLVWFVCKKNKVFQIKQCLNACSFCVWLGWTYRLFPQYNVAAKQFLIFPRGLCGLWSQQHVCWYVEAGDVQRWGAVTPSDRHSQDRWAWECSQSKPQTNYSFNWCVFPSETIKALKTSAVLYVSIYLPLALWK